MDRLRIDVRLRTELTRESVERNHPDAVIVATGSYQAIPAMQIEGGANVLTGRDLLEGHGSAKGRIIIVGGSSQGAHIAELLAGKGYSVTIVEASGEVAIEAPMDDRALLLGRLQLMGVNFVVNAKIQSIDSTGAMIAGPQGTRHTRA